MVIARESFEVYVDKDFNRVPYKDGNSLKDINKIVVKKGEEIPSELLSSILQYNRSWVDTATIKEDEKPMVKNSKPQPLKYDMNLLIKIENKLKDKSKIIALYLKIIREEFKSDSTSKNVGYLRNKILTLQGD